MKTFLTMTTEPNTFTVREYRRNHDVFALVSTIVFDRHAEGEVEPIKTSGAVTNAKIDRARAFVDATAVEN